MIAKNKQIQKIGKGVVLRTQKLTHPPLGPTKIEKGMVLRAEKLTRPTPLGRQKIFSNIGFMVFKRTGFATRLKKNNR